MHATVEDHFKALVEQGRIVVIRPVTPHALRHTFAVHSLHAGVAIEQLQLELGHASSDLTVNRYGRFRGLRRVVRPR